MGRKYHAKRFKNYRQIVNYSAQKFADKPAFILKSGKGEYEQVTYQKFRYAYYALCKKMIDEGLQGEAIAISGKNSYNWTLSYLCAATVGVAVPLDKEMSNEDKLHFMEEADCKAIFADDKILNQMELNEKKVKAYSLSEKMELDLGFGPEVVKKIDKIKIDKKKTQIIIFTSGTTGSSKGVCLSQYNICTNIHSTVSTVKITPKDKTLSMLPLHHTYECTLNCVLLLSRGACITYCDGIAKIKKNLQEYSPTILVVVPAVLNVMAKQINRSVIDKLPVKYSTYFENNQFAIAMSKLPFFIRVILRKKVRKELGGKLRMFIVGAAATEPEIISMFNSLGVKTLQGYGLTECSPLLAGNSDFYLNPDSTGKAVPGVQLRIINSNEDGIGEIVAKGENIMKGYFKDKEATKKTFIDGWFRTGDLGFMDEEGFLYIKGRLKNVIVTNNGKNIYPEELEKRLLDLNQVKECIVIGSEENGQTLVKAKVEADLEYLKTVLGHEPTPEEIDRIVGEGIEKVNDDMAPYKRIKRIEIVDELEKTTTQKVKRYGKNLE